MTSPDSKVCIYRDDEKSYQTIKFHKNNMEIAKRIIGYFYSKGSLHPCTLISDNILLGLSSVCKYYDICKTTIPIMGDTVIIDVHPGSIPFVSELKFEGHEKSEINIRVNLDMYTKRVYVPAIKTSENSKLKYSVIVSIDECDHHGMDSDDGDDDDERPLYWKRNVFHLSPGGNVTRLTRDNKIIRYTHTNRCISLNSGGYRFNFVSVGWGGSKDVEFTIEYGV